MIKLPRLPDRTPVKLTVWVSPDLNNGLNAYADLYANTYGKREEPSDLIPQILAAFLESDREFAKLRREAIRPTPPAHAASDIRSNA